jgi:aryl-alcohol dehydrogenase-like predicted oxidoreductase
MEKRKLGDLEVSALGLGCMSMSQAYGEPDRAESERALNRALEVGYTFFDTASMYGSDGHNESLIGEVLSDRRNEFVLASKCGLARDSQGRRYIDGKPETIKRTCEESLKRLRTDVIDLYYLHRRDLNVPIEDSVAALAELVGQGKVRAIGLSEVSSTTLRKAHAVHPITALQSEYSLWTRDPEYKVLDTCEELGITFVPFSPLGRMFLTGKLTSIDQLEENDLRRGMPRFQGENFQKNLALLKKFANIASNNNCTMAQLALAWVLAQRNRTLVPIPGTKHVKYVEENAAAAELKISADDLDRAGRLINADTVIGDRYADFKAIGIDQEE